MLKVCHLITSIDIINGGPSRSCTHLIKKLSDCNPELQITLNTFESKNPIIDSFESRSCKINFHKTKPMLFSYGLKNDFFKSNFKNR